MAAASPVGKKSTADSIVGLTQAEIRALEQSQGVTIDGKRWTGDFVWSIFKINERRAQLEGGTERARLDQYRILEDMFHFSVHIPGETNDCMIYSAFFSLIFHAFQKHHLPENNCFELYSQMQTAIDPEHELSRFFDGLFQRIFNVRAEESTFEDLLNYIRENREDMLKLATLTRDRLAHLFVTYATCSLDTPAFIDENIKIVLEGFSEPDPADIFGGRKLTEEGRGKRDQILSLETKQPLETPEVFLLPQIFGMGIDLYNMQNQEGRLDIQRYPGNDENSIGFMKLESGHYEPLLFPFTRSIGELKRFSSLVREFHESSSILLRLNREAELYVDTLGRPRLVLEKLTALKASYDELSARVAPEKLNHYLYQLLPSDVKLIELSPDQLEIINSLLDGEEITQELVTKINDMISRAVIGQIESILGQLRYRLENLENMGIATIATNVDCRTIARELCSKIPDIEKVLRLKVSEDYRVYKEFISEELEQLNDRIYAFNISIQGEPARAINMVEPSARGKSGSGAGEN